MRHLSVCEEDAMNTNELIDKINSVINISADELVKWLQNTLPRVTDSWWEDCVLGNLKHNQRKFVEDNKYDDLSEFDFAMLLRIANKSWYEMNTVFTLENSMRETFRDMSNVRNNWVQCGTELPGKDVVLHDLDVLKQFLSYFKPAPGVIDEIDQLIGYVESPNSIHQENELDIIYEIEDDNQEEISEKSIVYIVGEPEKRGIVFSATKIGEIYKYQVFVDNSLHDFYSGQIALVEDKKCQWVDVDTFRSYMAAFQINNPSANNLYSLNSARIDFVPYQFRPALKLIHSDEPRILIADSVGVGKTIEAGLIVKELEARGHLEKILVICPRPLVAERKWEIEMKRFDEEFIPMDGTSLRQAISDTDRDMEWPIRFNKAIIPYSILDGRAYEGEEDGKHGKQFGLSDLEPAPHFDLVIVDEAHHIRNGSVEKEKAYAYKCVKFFCDNADAVVMLTATPLQTSDDDLFTLLNVLRPDLVIDKATFTMMSRPNEFITKAARLARAGNEGWQHETIRALRDVRKTQWGDNVISENPLYDDILLRLGNDEITREERVQIISDVESLHSFNSMLNRTRRRDIQDFCIRRTFTIETEFTKMQRVLHDEVLEFERVALSTLHNPRAVSFMMSTIKRQAASCIFGLAPHIKDILDNRLSQINDDPDLDFSGFDVNNDIAGLSASAHRIMEIAHNLPEKDPKLEKTIEIIENKQQCENNKVILFSTFRHTLGYLKKKLMSKGYRVEQIDGSVKDGLRYKYKERFELHRDNPNAIDILLFTEVGSEGLDYQFCDLMINYDLPWNPMRIEQRIGRIDRRGQRSEAVNIYNMITADTVDATIYYRCLMRIGVFESSIGDCEEILGDIASKIEKIVVDSSLSEQERQLKLEQMADNDVRRIQEVTALEEEEKELFGFDLTECMTAKEIQRAENPWILPRAILHLVEHYIKARVGSGNYILGEGKEKTLRLNSNARNLLKEDFRKMPLQRSLIARAWDGYLSGKKPNQSITFDTEIAEKNVDAMFITPFHPLAKQAAAYFASQNEPINLYLEHSSNEYVKGEHLFSIYAWRYKGITTSTKLVIICNAPALAEDLPEIILENEGCVGKGKNGSFDWSGLDELHVKKWLVEKADYKNYVKNTVAYKIESLENNHRNRVRILERLINESSEGSIRRMRMGELENIQDEFDIKAKELAEKSDAADIHTDLIANGVILIK